MKILHLLLVFDVNVGVFDSNGCVFVSVILFNVNVNVGVFDSNGCVFVIVSVIVVC